MQQKIVQSISPSFSLSQSRRKVPKKRNFKDYLWTVCLRIQSIALPSGWQPVSLFVFLSASVFYSIMSARLHSRQICLPISFQSALI
jgi:hypothetical protein